MKVTVKFCTAINCMDGKAQVSVIRHPAKPEYTYSSTPHPNSVQEYPDDRAMAEREVGD